MIFLLLLLSNVAKAADMTNSVPTGTPYAPGMGYTFKIKCDEISNINSVNFEWNGLNNSASSTSPDTWYYTLPGLAAGSHSYKWYVSNATDSATFSNTYDVLQNSSVPIILTINGKTGNVSLAQYTIVNFVASLNIPGKWVTLTSNYPGFTTLTNISYLSYSTNLTDANIYMITASFFGDQNYTASSKTYYFDGGPPQITGLSNTPGSVVGYVPNAEYKFQANAKDANLVDVWFESNVTGSMTSYYYTGNGSVQNSSGVFWIIFNNLKVGDYGYRWHAKDDVSESATDFMVFRILKLQPLIMDILPSANVLEGTQVTATCFSIDPSEISVSNFGFYRNSEVIPNITSSTRMGTFLMSKGTYNFTCNTSGSGNYTNQSIKKTITVTSSPLPQQGTTGEFKIQGASFPSIETGNAGQASFSLVNTLQKNIFNITVNLTGVSSDWYTVSTKPSSVYGGETEDVKIDFNVPTDAEAKTYSITINVKGATSDGKTISTASNVNMIVTSPSINLPPSYATPNNNVTEGKIVFSLRWFADGGMSGYIFSSNMSGEWVNDSWTSLTGTSGSFDVEKNLNSTNDTVAWKIYSNDTSNAWTSSDEYTVSIKPAPSGYMNLLIIVVIAVIALAFAVIFITRMRKSKKEKVEYIYNKEADKKTFY
jgi:hypothetical protein